MPKGPKTGMGTRNAKCIRHCGRSDFRGGHLLRVDSHRRSGGRVIWIGRALQIAEAALGFARWRYARISAGDKPSFQNESPAELAPSAAAT
jgi:hypothetical protein